MPARRAVDLGKAPVQGRITIVPWTARVLRSIQLDEPWATFRLQPEASLPMNRANVDRASSRQCLPARKMTVPPTVR